VLFLVEQSKPCKNEDEDEQKHNYHQKRFSGIPADAWHCQIIVEPHAVANAFPSA
jgi:hypothetical protein